MRKIARIPHNGLNVVSTFAGCGGSSLGYRMAGFRVLLASEFVEAARDVYKANARPGTIVDERDIREVDPLELLRVLNLKPGELDVLDGSPPCASFSTAGKREKHWGAEKAYSDKRQRTDDLFYEFIRFVRAMQPKVFVAENVSGLVKGVAKGYFLDVLAQMKKCGYRVSARLLDAQWLGVPQQRQRIIFIGVRDDLGLEPAFPAPLPYRYSVRDALPWLASGTHDAGRKGQRAREIADVPCPTITVGAAQARDGGGVRNHFKIATKKGERSADLPAPTVQTHGNRYTQSELTIVQTDRRTGETKRRDLTVEPCPTINARYGYNIGNVMNTPYEIEGETDIAEQAIGREYDRLNPGEASDKYFNLVRSDAGAPAPTITASGGQNSGIACAVHPTEKRKFAIAELKRICGFPDDFVLTGTYAQQWERLGRAVPPPMMFRIASAVAGLLLRSPPRTAAPGRRSRDRSRSGSGRKDADTFRRSSRRPKETTTRTAPE